MICIVPQRYGPEATMLTRYGEYLVWSVEYSIHLSNGENWTATCALVTSAKI